MTLDPCESFNAHKVSSSFVWFPLITTTWRIASGYCCLMCSFMCAIVLDGLNVTRSSLNGGLGCILNVISRSQLSSLAHAQQSIAVGRLLAVHTGHESIPDAGQADQFSVGLLDAATRATLEFFSNSTWLAGFFFVFFSVPRVGGGKSGWLAADQPPCPETDWKSGWFPWPSRGKHPCPSLLRSFHGGTNYSTCPPFCKSTPETLEERLSFNGRRGRNSA